MEIPNPIMSFHRRFHKSLKCNILIDGSVKNCRVIKPLPHLSEAVLAAMGSMTCKPATFQGQPISIDYVQNFQFKLPR